jgi:ribosome maturation factor RimP
VELKKNIGELAEQCIEARDIFLVEVDIKGNTNNQKIQVFIDGDQSEDIDECSRISRKLSGMLEESGLIAGSYVIEVSSPGVSRPLKYLRQYPKHIGRDLEIVKKDKSKIKCELLDVTDEEIVISIVKGKSKKILPDKNLKMSFSEIDSAKVLVRF